MKEKIKVTAVVMFLGVIFSGILVAYKLVNTIIPSFDGGSASVFDYLLIVTVTVSMVLKLAVGSMGLRAVSKKTSPPAGYAKNVENFGQTRSSACAYRSA